MFKKLHYYLRDYFAFNQTEIKGFMFLIFLLALWIISIFIFDFLPDNPKNVQSIDAKKVEEMIAKIEVKEIEKKNQFQERYQRYDDNSEKDFTENRIVKLSPFDPNLASQEQLETLGLPKWLAKRVINYRSKGGQFRKKEDLQRIYDFPADLYTQLEPYISLPEKNNQFTVSKTENAPETKTAFIVSKAATEISKPISFDLNRADTNDLKKLKGIGSKLSARIIKYRDILGGFYSENQVREVFGLDSTTIVEVLKYGNVKNPTLRKIKINEVNAEDFKHPYIRPYVAKSIIAYRQQHGNFTSKKDFEPIKLLDSKTLDKVFPYFEL